MKFVPHHPSLEQMALVEIVALLWKQNDVRQLIRNLGSSNMSSREEWKQILKTISEKASQLLLPQLLIEKMERFIHPIGFEIVKWIGFHSKNYNIPPYLPAEFRWTPHGTVDRKRTAEVLVKDENVDIATRYKLACIYFLHDEINKIWNHMPDNLKDSVSNQEAVSANLHNKDLFYQSVEQINKVAAKYYLQKLTPEEKAESLVEAAKHTDDPDTVCFLLSEMNEEQQMEVFKYNPSAILQCFLRWPLQSFFIEIANCMWDFLSTEDYASLFCNITNKFSHIDWDYQNLFREFWQESPSALKNSIRNELHKCSFLEELFILKDKEKVRLILKDTTVTAKNKLIYGINMQRFCVYQILTCKWDVLEFFIQELFLLTNSMHEMLLFKSHFEKVMEHPMLQKLFETVKSEWNKLFPNLAKRRNVEEGQSSTSKRFHRLQ